MTAKLPKRHQSEKDTPENAFFSEFLWPTRKKMVYLHTLSKARLPKKGEGIASCVVGQGLRITDAEAQALAF